MTTRAAVVPHYWPNLAGKAPPEVEQAVRMLYTAQQEHETAFASLKTQLTAVQTAQKATSTTASASTAVVASSAAAVTTTPTLGTVNNQTGTAYTVQDQDYGAIVTFANTAAVAVALNSAVRQYWFAAFENIGTGTVSVSPQQGTINGYASIGLTQNMGAWIFFDGSNWWAMTVPTQPVSLAPAPTMYLTGYNATTGAFSEAQPAFSDLSGSATTAQVPALSALSGAITQVQLPAGGASGTVKLAALTASGTAGSITLQAGLVTSFTNPT